MVNYIGSRKTNTKSLSFKILERHNISWAQYHYFGLHVMCPRPIREQEFQMKSNTSNTGYWMTSGVVINII